MDDFFTWKDHILKLAINLQPRSSKDEILLNATGILKIKITAAPANNEANNYLIKFMAKTFGVTQAQVTIVKGLQSRKKTLMINKPKKIPSELQAYVRIE